MENLALQLTSAIHATRERWLSDALVPNISAIGNGMCDQFVEEVMNSLGLSGHVGNYSGPIRDLQTDDWWTRILNPDGSDAGAAECFHIDIPRLRAEGAPLPDPTRYAVTDEELAHFLGGATHVWLFLDGRHYDAGAPDGVDHFLRLPFFADQLSAWLSSKERK